MQKNILLTGATDGIGFETAKKLAGDGHRLIIHGRSEEKLQATEQALKAIDGCGDIHAVKADLSNFSEVSAMADQLLEQFTHLDALINNAGIFRTQHPITQSGLDVRFAVNTLAPYLLVRKLLPILSETSRVVNLSSAAQAPVNIDALKGRQTIDDEFQAYAQSKLAITQWTCALAEQYPQGPVFIAVNPGSMLGSKMVKEGFGVAGGDLSIGANILYQAALDESFANASGKYFDNDSQQFAPPHSDAQSAQKNQQLVAVLEQILES